MTALIASCFPAVGVEVDFDSSQESSEGIACVAYEMDELDEEWDEILLLLEIEAAEEALDRCLSAEAENDEAIAHCLAEAIKSETKAQPRRAQKSYLQAAQTKDAFVERSALPTTSSPIPSPSSPKRNARRKIHKEEYRIESNQKSARVAALEMQGLALRSRVDALRAHHSSSTDATNILARDRAKAQLQNSRKQEDAAAALMFAANNHQLVTVRQHDGSLSFVDVLDQAIANLDRCPADTINLDLHHLSVANARLTVAAFLDALAKIESKPLLKIIAGRGIHSTAGRPRLAPAVRRDLDARPSISFREEQIGTYIVRVSSKRNRRRRNTER